MNYIQSIVLGVIEGVTEFLPISSTAHLILTSHILGIPFSDAIKSFEIIIQLGAICSILFLYTKKLLENTHLIKNIIAGFIPTAIIGFTLYPFIKNVLLESLTTIAYAFIIGGLVIVFFEKRKPLENTKTEVLDIKKSFLIGCFQSLAIIPGVSRSGATIIGGLSLGISRKEIVEFSFLLALPVIAGASFLDLLKSYKSILLSNMLPELVVGFIVAFFTALAVVKWFIRYIQNHTFTAFGYYRIIVGILILIFLGV